MAASLSRDLHRAWDEDGWFVLESAISSDQLAAARKALSHMFPSPQAMSGDLSSSEELDRWRTWDAPWPEFPFHSRTLNGLVLSDLMLDLAEKLLGTDDVRMYLAMATAKFARQSSGYNRLLHADYPNHTLTVPRAEPGYNQMETFIYLNDVTADNGATRFVSRRRTQHIAVEEHTLNLHDHALLYEETSDASAPAGSIVVYRPDVYHRSVDFGDPSQARYMLHASYKPARMEWGGYQAWPIKGFSPEWHNFVQRASVRQLTAVGFPAPGNDFWNPATLLGVGRRYPGLDLSPWEDAMAPSSSPRW